MKKAVAVLLLFAGAASAAPSGPGSGANSNPVSDAAVSYLRDVAAGKVDGDPTRNTALSKDLGRERLTEIRRQLARLRGRLRPADLVPLADKEDGDLAAVLVSQVSGHDASTIQVHAVAMIQRAGKWLPAPLPASFESTGISFEPGLLPRARALEDWMLRTSSSQLVSLRENAFSVLQGEMKRSVPLEVLQKGQPEELVRRLLDACGRSDLPATLALFGGLENVPPTDWDETVRIVRQALDRPEKTHPVWRMLCAPEPLRAMVSAEQTTRDGMISLVVLDPGTARVSRIRPRTLHLPLVHGESGLWRFRLSDLLREANPDPRREEEMMEQEAAMDENLIARFPQKLREAIPAAPAAGARPALEALSAALRAPSLATLVPLLDLEGEAANANESLTRMAILWDEFHSTRDRRGPLTLDFQEQEADACAIFQCFSATKPVDANFATLFFHRGEDGWLVNPAISEAAALSIIDNESGAPLAAWLKDARERLTDDWSGGVLPRFKGPAADQAPTEEDARRIAAAWHAARDSGDPAALFAASASFDDEDGPTRALRNLGHELLSRGQGAILAVQRGRFWTAVSMRVEETGGDFRYPLTVLATTPAGPRVIAEIDLRDSSDRTREYLNRTTFDRVTGLLGAPAGEELRQNYEKHRTTAAADREGKP